MLPLSLLELLLLTPPPPTPLLLAPQLADEEEEDDEEVEEDAECNIWLDEEEDDDDDDEDEASDDDEVDDDEEDGPELATPVADVRPISDWVGWDKGSELRDGWVEGLAAFKRLNEQPGVLRALKTPILAPSTL